MMYRHFILLLLFFLGNQNVFAQKRQSDKDAFYIRTIYDKALTESRSYEWLTYLSTRIGGRLSGSPQAAAAVEYTRQMLDTLGLDTVYLQPCLVPHWERGGQAQLRIVNSNAVGSLDLKTVSLGNSTGTGKIGITAEVIEVKSLDAVDSLGGAGVKGKIVFYNRPMDAKQLNTFAAYGGAVGQRAFGASRAAEYGAVGVVVRSMTTRLDDVPHTGTIAYAEGEATVPALSISTNDAEKLSQLLQYESIQLYMQNDSRMSTPKPSYNVIGEIKGSEFPDEIILVGGHLDSWDIGQGAHDDGAGCVQAMDVLQLMKRLNYRSKRTIRAVLFMNEENGQAGAIAYRDASMAAKEYHLGAIESDRGGFTPRGFTCDADASVFEEKFKKLGEWLPLLSPYGLDIRKGGSGADISRLKPQKGMLFGLLPDSQRYFDYHHTGIDNIETVNKRELELGTAAMLSLVYLMDQYGL
ncbi:MAG: M28 family peptidase [Bacteroidota bacterium]